jgi:hypothetical protein
MSALRYIILNILLLVALSSYSAETTFHCVQFQRDIDYWQRVYQKEVKKREDLEKELMELKMKELEKGVRIPEAIQSAELSVIDTGDSPRRQEIHNHYHY